MLLEVTKCINFILGSQGKHCVCVHLLNFLRLYVEEKLGTKYVEKTAIPFEVSYQESGPATPVFFVLSPGVDPLKDVEALGKKLGFTTDNQNFHNVSLGQGQEIVAENALDLASKDGHWVILQVV